MTEQKENSDIVATNTDVIISQPEYFFAAQKTTLEARISKVSLSDEELEEIQAAKGKKVLRDALLGTFLIGKISKVVIDWNEGVDK